MADTKFPKEICLILPSYHLKSGVQVLTEHFLADGIDQQAFVLEFLPMCVANARSNALVGRAPEQLLMTSKGPWALTID